MRYFITFACYGVHLHGVLNRVLSTDSIICLEADWMNQTPYLLDRDRRTIVLEALREVCLHRADESRSRRSGSGGSTRESHWVR